MIGKHPSPYPAGVYVRNDDPLEYVRILSQERTPNGLIEFEFLAPEAAQGSKDKLSARLFHSHYHDPHEKVEDRCPPVRPSSAGTKEQWRAYALWLEERYHRPKPPVYRGGDPIGPTIPGGPETRRSPLEVRYRNSDATPDQSSAGAR